MNREQTILNHLDYVKATAAKLCLSKGIADQWTIKECQSEAVEALIQCVDTYDNSMGASFTTYIYKRTQGSVLDYFRHETGFQIRSNKKTNTERFNWLNHGEISEMSNSLKYFVNGTEKTVCNKDLCGQIFKYTDNINSKYNISEILRLYYFDGYTLKEIGGVFNVSDSRVFQIINYALRKIRRVFDDSTY